MNFKKIEHNLFEHFKYLPQLLGCEVKLAHGVTSIKSMLNTSMFNIVCEVNIDGHNLNQVIDKIISEYNGDDFAFWMKEDLESIKLCKALEERGFVSETTEYAMMCDLRGFKAKNIAHLAFKLVDNKKDMQDFISIIEVYDKNVREFYEKLENPSVSKKEKFFIGYKDDEAVVIAILYCENDTAGIFSLITKESYRRKGYGNEMMLYLMDFAQKNDFSYASLSASSAEGLRVYERLGFKVLGKFKCLERRL